MADNFDEFAEENPKQEPNKGISLRIWRPGLGRFVRQVHEESVDEKSPAGQSRKVDSIGTPGLLSVFDITN